jgi:hypothetical protein
LGGLAVLVVIALSVTVTVLVLRPDSGGSVSPTPPTGESEFASAGDDGPVNIIAEDPTCAAWGKVAREYSDEVMSVGWANHDVSVPATAWTPEQRKMYETVGDVMTRAAGQTVGLAKQTPHRVMRELYEQFIAYAHAFDKRISTYVAEDNNLAVTTDALMIGAADICSAIDYRSAPTIAPLISDPAQPSRVSSPGDLAEPVRFLADSNPICADWASLVKKYSADTATWRALDRKTPATEWTPDEKSANDAVASVMSANADQLEQLGRQSDNPTLEDIAVLAAQYQRGFVAALPNYTPTDNFLAESATHLIRTIDWACKAAV